MLVGLRRLVVWYARRPARLTQYRLLDRIDALKYELCRAEGEDLSARHALDLLEIGLQVEDIAGPWLAPPVSAVPPTSPESHP